MLIFFINNNRILIKITILFLMKNSNNNIIILGFSFMYLVSVYPMNRTKETILKLITLSIRFHKNVDSVFCSLVRMLKFGPLIE